MAIYIGIEMVDEDQNTKYYSFRDSSENEYGVLAIDIRNGEIELVKTTNSERIEFAFPRARKAVLKYYESGELPKRLSYAA